MGIAAGGLAVPAGPDAGRSATGRPNPPDQSGVTQWKLAASSVLPAPSHRATWG